MVHKSAQMCWNNNHLIKNNILIIMIVKCCHFSNGSFKKPYISQPYNGAVVLLLLPCCFPAVPSGKFSAAAKWPKMIGFWILKCLWNCLIEMLQLVGGG